jgi:hypothetical protein
MFCNGDSNYIWFMVLASIMLHLLGFFDQPQKTIKENSWRMPAIWVCQAALILVAIALSRRCFTCLSKRGLGGPIAGQSVFRQWMWRWTMTRRRGAAYLSLARNAEVDGDCPRREQKHKQQVVSLRIQTTYHQASGPKTCSTNSSAPLVTPSTSIFARTSLTASTTSLSSKT